MGNLSGFDAQKVDPQTSFDVLPAGWYEAYISNSEMKPTKSGNGKFLLLEMEIMGGQYSGRKVWDRLNLINPNDKAVEIAKAVLSSICRAVGVMTPQDSSDLHNRPLMIKLAVTKDDQYGERNEVKGYEKKDGSKPVPEPAHVDEIECPF